MSKFHKPRTAPKKWKTRLAPKLRGEWAKGKPSAWKRVRRLLLSWWPWAVLGIAAVALHWWWSAAFLTVFGAVCFLLTPAERPPRFGLDHDFAVADPDFIPTVTGATGVTLTHGNKIVVFNNGREFYPAMLDAIKQAQTSITIEAYIYWAGEIGLQFAKAIAERASAGVQVKILLDSVGSSSIGDEILEILEGGHCQLGWYNPIRWWSMERFNHRTHRKSLIIDGKLAFTGGAGIADHWQGNAEDPDHWRDIQIQMEGPCVVPLQSGFAHNWTQTTSELISGEAFYPATPPAGELPAITIMSSPEVGSSTVRTMYYLSIACARHSIYIANPYFIPDEVAIDLLVDAHKRGVDVQIMMAGIHNDNWIARKNSVRLYGRLLEAGITLLEYRTTMMHQKTMVVDGQWATIGTTNFDNRSFSHNDENNVCVPDKQWALALQQVFFADIPSCDRITIEAWRKRGLGERLGEIVASILEEQS